MIECPHNKEVICFQNEDTVICSDCEEYQEMIDEETEICLKQIREEHGDYQCRY